MSDKIKDVMDPAVSIMANEMGKVEQNINLKLHNALEICFEKSNDNPDRFSQCIANTNKKISQLSEHFQLKTMFLQRAAQSCLQNGNNVKVCQDKIGNIGKEIIKSLLLQIERV